MAALTFDTRRRITAGKLETVAPGIRRLAAGNAGPYTFTGTNSFIVGEGTVAVIDPGPDEAGHLSKLIDAVAGETVSHVVVTHTHLDHSALAMAFAAHVGAPAVAFGVHGAGRTRDLAVDGPDQGADLAFRPDATLGDGEVLEGPGWRLEAMHTPGHTANHVCLALRETGDLFCGDHVMGWSTSVVIPPDGDMGAYRASQERLLSREESRYWPAHGGSIDDPKPYIEALLEHRRERDGQFLDALREAPGTASDIAGRVYAGLDTSLHTAAVYTTLAHLVDLAERGLVETGDRHGMAAVYRMS